MCQQLGWLVNLEKSELEPKQNFNFIGYQLDLRSDRVWPTPDRWQNLQEKMLKLLIPTGLPGPGIHVLDRFANSYRKASSSRPTSYETHSVASQTQLEGPRITGKGDPNPQVLAPPFTMMAEGRQCPYSPTITPNKTCSANIYRHINRRVGRSLRWALCKSNLITSGKQVAYKISRTLSSFSDFKEFQDLCSKKIVLVATVNTTVVSYIKEGGMTSGPLCALLWRILTWCTRKQVTLKHDTFQAGLMW